MSTVTLAAAGKVTFTGRNGVGDISVPGIKNGDVLIFTYAGSWFQPDSNGFAYVVTADDTIHQTTASDLSATTITAIFFRGP